MYGSCRTSSHRFVALAACTLLLGTAPAFAQDKGADDASAALTSARKLAKKGKFKKAAVHFEKAFRIEGSKNALFGWAQAERMAGNCRQAYFNYARLLRMTPSAKQVEVVQYGMRECEKKLGGKQVKSIRTRLDELEKKEKERDKQVALAAQRKELEEKSRVEKEEREREEARQREIDALTRVEKEEPTSRVPAYVLMISGGVVALAGGGALYLAHDYSGREAPTFQEQVDNNDKAETWELVSTISLASGGGLVAAGLIYFLVAGEDEPTEAPIGLMSGPGDVGLALGGRF